MARALLIIDFQNDFASPDGALSVPEGDTVAGRINELAASGDFDLVVATRDWHPADHGSFAEHGGPWPRHCVQDTWGAELHPDLARDRIDLVVDKGTDAGTEGYSAFEGTGLETILRERGVDEAVVVGLATDYCVRASALDALALGVRATVDPDAVRPVEVNPGDGERALREVREAGLSYGRSDA
jgi:nicotinamidase-related amidase